MKSRRMSISECFPYFSTSSKTASEYSDEELLAFLKGTKEDALLNEIVYRLFSKYLDEERNKE